jgi:hypothetical protein
MICRIPDATLPKESSRRDKMLDVYYQLLAVKVTRSLKVLRNQPSLKECVVWKVNFGIQPIGINHIKSNQSSLFVSTRAQGEGCARGLTYRWSSYEDTEN